jgi:hypothetical protein
MALGHGRSAANFHRRGPLAQLSSTAIVMPILTRTENGKHSLDGRAKPSRCSLSPWTWTGGVRILVNT